ncbi:piggyBac transposable element-derived protein 4-like [Rhinichthys klamathensis goyatoka]|uniref:piggyBac transposable element-derived protein 4-like n=1 Tax=Rhinichthys klamathensis goyatoka TaxID=3034132 RepID=UPI0024B54D6C|nr:piggyBac transposable element-derived protein 4-like [Rhinichthys klamathensis goyatoka]
MAKTLTLKDALAAILDSSDEDERRVSEPDGFSSDEDEDYDHRRDPVEDGEDSQLPGPSVTQAASPVPATRSPPAPTPQSFSPARPAKRFRTPQHQPAPPPTQQPSSPTRPAKRSRNAQHQPAPPPTQQPAPLSWKTEKDPDIAPPVSRFQPARTPGPQLSSTSTYTPLDLFKLFFPVQIIQTLCQNTNKQAAKQMAQGKKYKWLDVNIGEFYKYIGLLLYMAMVKLDSIADYWRQNHFFSLPLPVQIMPRDRYRALSWNLHLSDPEEDVQNDKKKGTADHDKLFRLKPLMNTIKNACKSFYHPHRDVAVDERMVASKAKTGMTQYMKAKPIKWGFKLFVLADSRNGYTVDFSVYTGKSDIPSGHGLSYDVVMSLVQPGYLGTGYHIYMDNFYSSPKLFRALHEQKFAACGTYRENRKDCPRTTNNALTKKSERGSIRWIRDGPLIYVKWMDTREVSVCSTLHTAHSGNTVQRRVKQQDGSWTKTSIPCPTPVLAYNEHMGGVDHSDQLIQYYSAQHKTMRWYRHLFYHFLDIATTNSYILHKELCLAQQTTPMTHRAFMEELTAELCGKPLHTAPVPVPAGHIPVPIAVHAADSSTKATTGRSRCEHCQSQGQRKDLGNAGSVVLRFACSWTETVLQHGMTAEKLKHENMHIV